MSDGFIEFGFGSEGDALRPPTQRFKAKEGETYRVSFAWWPGIEDGEPDMSGDTPKFVGGKRHYIPGVGYVLNKGPEYTKIAGGEQPKMAIATVVVCWPTDANGSLDKGRFASGDFDVKSWVFSQSKYNALQPINTEFPLGKHDLTIQCTDTQYQKLSFSPCRENLLRKLAESSKKAQKELFGSIYAAVSNVVGSIHEDIARDVSLDQIREKLGSNGGGVSTPVDTGVTEDFEGVLDDILE
jgi:hypothetical protein